MEDKIKCFKALADKNRFRILKMLERQPLCVCEIKSALNISTSTVSSHLTILKEAGFITDTRDGKWVEYRYNRSSNEPMLHQILAMIPAWLNDEEIIKEDSKKMETVDREIICKVNI